MTRINGMILFQATTAAIRKYKVIMQHFPLDFRPIQGRPTQTREIVSVNLGLSHVYRIPGDVTWIDTHLILGYTWATFLSLWCSNLAMKNQWCSRMFPLNIDNYFLGISASLICHQNFPVEQSPNISKLVTSSFMSSYLYQLDIRNGWCWYMCWSHSSSVWSATSTKWGPQTIAKLVYVSHS